jgi:hypothetical protein
MTELVKEVNINFKYQVMKIRGEKNSYNRLYVTVDLGGKQIKFETEPNGENLENILKDLEKLNELRFYADANEKLEEGLSELMMKLIAMLIWEVA